MDLLSLLSSLWPVVVVAAIIGGVFIALAQCAVAELVIRLAAHLYCPSNYDRQLRLEEWRRCLADMKPSERPAYAASLLWAAQLRFLSAVFVHLKINLDASVESDVRALVRTAPEGFQVTERFWCAIFVDFSELSNDGLSAYTDRVSDNVRRMRHAVDCVIVPGDGTTLFGTRVAQDSDLPCVMLDDNTPETRGLRAVIVDDVAYDGLRAAERVLRARALGYIVQYYAVFLNRTDGDAVEVLRGIGVEVIAVLQGDDDDLGRIVHGP